MRVLVVEDDDQLRHILVRVLTENKYDVEQAADGVSGDLLAADGGFDVMVLDWIMPHMSGLEICRRARAAGNEAGIIMLTAKDDIRDRIDGLDVGADDYLTKPFNVDELLARVRAVARRGTAQRSAIFTAGRLSLDTRTRRVFIDGVDRELTTREFDLLAYLLRSGASVATRSAIEDRIWGSRFEPTSNVVDVFIRRLRRKLGACGAMIETVRGSGYRLGPEALARDDDCAAPRTLRSTEAN